MLDGGSEFTLDSWLKEASRLTHPHGLGLVLMAYVLKKPKTWVLSHSDLLLSPEQLKQLDELTNRLLKGEPLAYLTGEQAFFGLSFIVSPAVLIPRPETEILVEEALRWLSAHPQARQVADVGTGSGCIAVTLAFHRPEVEVVATDISEEALTITRQNAERYSVSDRIALIHSDLLPSSDASFDLVCANLPYIPTGKLSEVNSLPYEPRLALDGGKDGLDLIRRLLNLLPAKIHHPGLILLEIEALQGQVALSLAKDTFPGSKISLRQDLAGLDRLIQIEVN